MSKNMIHKKGLAVVAGSALFLSVLAAPPAMAAATILTEVDAGTSTTGVISLDVTTTENYFVLRTTTSSADAGKLKYRIQNPSGVEVEVKLDNDGDATTLELADSTPDQIFKTGTTTADTTVTSKVGTFFTDFVVDAALFGIATPAVGVNTNDNLLGIAIDRATGPVSLTVTAWLDTVAGTQNRLDSVEAQAASVTINFVQESSITWTASTTQVAGASTVSALVTASPDINGNYFSGTVAADISRPGSSVEKSEALTFDSTDNNWQGSGVSLTGSVDWTGMQNNSGLTFSSASGSAAVSYTTSRGTFVTTGDIVRVQSAVSTLVATRAVVQGVNVNDFTILQSAIAGVTTSVVARAADAGHVAVLERKLTNVVVAAATPRVATFTTLAPHGLTSGDIVSLNAVRTALNSARTAVTGVGSSTTFTVAFATDQTVFSGSDAGHVAYISAFEVVAGTYAAQVTLNGNDVGTASSSGTLAPVAAKTLISTTASASIGNAVDADNNGAYETTKVKAGTLSVTVVATVVDKDDKAVGAGRVVTVSNISNRTGTVLVNTRSALGQVLTTDANGQVTLTVTTTAGSSTEGITVEVTPEGTAAAKASFVLDWETQSYGLYDLNTTSANALATSTVTTVEDGSYTMRLAVLDQWFQAPAAGDYRLRVTGSGINSGFFTFTNGVAELTMSDNDTAASYAAEIDLQKLTGAVYAKVGSTTTITMQTKAGKLLTAADGSSLYSDETADLSDVVALKALVEIDNRLANTVAPAYVNSLLVTGQVVDSSTLAGLAGALVTITGPSNILFLDGAVAKRGSLTFLSESDGDFSVILYSTTAQASTELTITALGVSTTVKVTFTGQTAGEGSVLTIDAPSNVKSASSFQVTVKLADALGNGVSTGTNNTIKISRTGAGIAFGALPMDTDANGNASFSVLLGSNDSGTIIVTAQYDQNDDGDYVDAKDITVTKTITIGAVASDTIVNVGTFSGKLVVYALNAAGSEVSYKIAGKWVTQVVTSDLLQRYDRVVGATGKTIKVDIYVDGVLKVSKSVVTK